MSENYPHTPSDPSNTGLAGPEGPGLGPEDVKERKAAKNKQKNKKILKGVGYVVAATVLLGIGGAAGGNADEKEVEVIKEVEVPGETVTETETVTEEVTPQVCVDALRAADGVFLDLGDLFGGTIMNTIEAAAVGDVAGIEQGTQELEEFNERLNANSYREDADACLMKQ